MKKLLSILCLVLLVSLSTEVSFSQSIQEDCDLLCQLGQSQSTQTQENQDREERSLTGPFLIRGEITYDQKTNEPITGNIETFYYNGQLKQRGKYINGQPVGLHESFHVNGQLKQKGNYKDGEQEGLWEMFDEGGYLTDTKEYIRGELFDDLEVVNNENGKPESKTYYKNGEEVFKTSFFYYENGQLSFRVNYKNEKLDGLWETFYLNGQLMSKGNYKEGKRLFAEHYNKKNQRITNGTLEDYYENGQLRLRTKIKNGKMNGLFETFHENGQLQRGGNVIDEKEEGLWRYYDENGKETTYSPECWENGETVDCEEE